MLKEALREAKDFDPWATIPDDPPLHLPPDMYAAPERPPEDSAYAPLPGIHHSTPLPWHRDVAAGETTKQFTAFRHYLALGPARTLSAAANELNSSPGTLSKWASAYNWGPRAAAFDAYQDEQYERELLRRVREMADRHASTFSQALVALSTAFAPLAHDPEAIAEELEGLSVKEKLRLATQAAKAMPALATAERLALGMPTEHTSTTEHHVIHHEMKLDDLKGVLGGLIEAGVLEKQSSRSKEEDNIIDAEVIEDDEEGTP